MSRGTGTPPAPDGPPVAAASRLLRSPAFLAGAALRLALLPVLGSSYLTDLFIPFLDQAVLHPTQNPWSLSPPSFFPYGSVLFAILFVPRWLAHALFGGIALGTGPLGLALVKGPLLALDLLLLLLLARLAPRREREVTWLYWLNPVLVYVTYVHGQLDVAAMMFLVLGLYLLAADRILPSALAMAAAALCKFQVVLVIPFVLVFLWNRHFVRRAARSIGAWIAVAVAGMAIGFAPVVLGGRLLYVTAGSPEAFRLFAARLDLGGGSVLYVGVLLVVVLLGRLCIATRITEEGMVLGSGMLLGILVAVTHAAPGWYFWIFPFLALFFANQAMAPRALYWALVALYFLHFVGSPLLPAPQRELASSLSFTLLQTALVGTLIALWTMSLGRNVPLAGRGRPLLIGIAGDSATGKNTLSEALADLFNPGHTLVVEGDDYHKWERGHDKWQDYTHLNPKANDLLDLAGHVRMLVEGGLALRPHYDHGTGRFTAPRELRPARTIVVQGLHTLYLREMRDRFDLRIFMDHDERVRLAWKLSRDAVERGQSADAILAAFRKRREDGERHIGPQRDAADWVIRMVPAGEITEEEILAGGRPRVVAHHVLWNDAPIDGLLEAFAACPGLGVTIGPVEGDFNRIDVALEGDPSAAEVAEIARRAFPTLRQVTRGRRPPVWRAGLSGLNQLMAVALLERAAERT